MPDDLDDQIRENAAGPAKAYGDAGSIEQHKLTDQIAADKHLAAKKAVAKPNCGVCSNEIVPPSGNHWLDCLVGCAVAASMQGALLFETDRLSSPKREPVSFGEMQKQRRR